MTEMISLHSIEYAESVLRRPADGSEANKAARAKAKNHLIQAAFQFEEFANKNPNSAPAQFLRDKAKAMRITAMF